MKGIAARLRHIVDHAAHVATVLGVKVGDDLEFLENICIANKNRGAGDGVVVILLAVNLEVIGAAALSVDGEAGAVAVAEAGAFGGGDARHQKGQGIEAVADRQILGLDGLKGIGNLRGLALDQRRSLFHGHDLFSGAGGHGLRAQRGILAGLHHHVVQRQLGKRGCLYADGVSADRQVR